MKHGGLIEAIIEHTRGDVRASTIRVVEELEAKERAWGQAAAETAERQKGRWEGHAELLLWQLEHRFGPLPGPLKVEVLAAPPQQVERWAMCVLTATSLEEVLRPV